MKITLKDGESANLIPETVSLVMPGIDPENSCVIQIGTVFIDLAESEESFSFRLAAAWVGPGAVSRLAPADEPPELGPIPAKKKGK